MNKELILRHVRLSFSQGLTELKASKAGDKPRYSSNFIIEMDTPEGKKTKAELDAVIDEIMKEEFKGRTIEGKDLFLRKGDSQVNADGEVYEGYEGNYYLSGARSEKRGAPLVVGKKASAGAIARNHDEFPESGDYVNLKCNVFSLNGKNDKGGDPSHGKKICLEIGTVQFVEKGKPLGGGGKPNTSGLEDLADTEDDIG